MYNKALEEWKKGNGRLAYVGSCVLAIVVHNDNLFVANLGDSKARLFRRKDNKFEAMKISKTFNACKKEEQERLRKQFDDPDIIVTPRENVSYVKGRLQPTKVYISFYLLDSW